MELSFLESVIYVREETAFIPICVQSTVIEPSNIDSGNLVINIAATGAGEAIVGKLQLYQVIWR